MARIAQAYKADESTITPYPGGDADLPADKTNFNHLQSSMRMPVECAFGRLAGMWGALDSLTPLHPPPTLTPRAPFAGPSRLTAVAFAAPHRAAGILWRPLLFSLERVPSLILALMKLCNVALRYPGNGEEPGDADALDALARLRAGGQLASPPLC